MSSTATRRPRPPSVIVRVVVAALCGSLLALFAMAGPASAHAVLLGTSPSENAVLDEAPSSAELRFNEPVDLIDDAIRFFPSDGEAQVLDAETRNHSVIVALPRHLPNGTYSLSYRVVSADGHPVGGAVTFHVGEESASASAPSTPDADVTPASTETAVFALTVVQYLGLLLFSGLLFFHTVIQRLSGGPDRGSVRLARWSVACALGASVLLIPASALRITGQSITSIVAPGSWGPGVLAAPVSLAAIVALTGSAALLLFERRLPMVHRRPAVIAGVVSGALAAASPVLVGHSQTTEPIWLMVVADIAHLLVGAFWLGGVVGLFRAIRTAAPARNSGSEDVDKALRVTARFSRYALWSVIVLALSGTLMATLILTSPGQLLATGYGRTLLIKLVIVMATITIAAWNRRRILPDIAAEPRMLLRWASLRRTLRYEATLLCAVIALTAFLGNSSPDHNHAAQGSTPTAVAVPVHVRSQGLVIDGVMEPGRAGANTFSFQATLGGEKIAEDSIDVSARLPEQQLGPFDATTTRDSSTGRFEAPLTLPVSGDWQIQVAVRVSRFEEPIAVVPVHIE